MEKNCIYDPLKAFIAHYSHAERAETRRDEKEARTVEERLTRRIIDGDAIGLEQDLEEARATHPPIDIINTILLDGMKTVGELFGSGQMQLPFVLQSAEVMKKAVGLLEPFMDRLDGIQKGTIVLATVKGDVHDIGKNLVDIILTNNGYRVVNLGIKIGIEAVLAAVVEHRADAIGMSGLLVKSTLVMKENLQLMEARALRTPVVLGGAALTRRYVEQDLRAVYTGTLAYARDAFDGLTFMESLAALPPGAASATDAPARRSVAARADDSAIDRAPLDARRSSVATDVPIPRAPFLGSKLVTEVDLEQVFAFINPVALIRGQWQVRRGRNGGEADHAVMEQEMRAVLDSLKQEALRDGLLAPAVVYGYFPCNADGNDLVIYRPRALTDDRIHDVWPAKEYGPEDLVEWLRFGFPRQNGDRDLCIADFLRPIDTGSVDVCAFQIVTMGAAASRHSAALFAADRYQEYLYFHGFSVECAEALAEYWHKRVRTELGIAGGDADDIRRLFSQGYQGSRFSFGYPACPDLEDQQKLFTLLRPERAGITLTEEYQLVPEQSTSAIVVHHPEAKYFMVKD